MGLIHRIEISVNDVEIDNWIVERPSYIAPSEWEDFWEAVRDFNDDFFEDGKVVEK